MYVTEADLDRLWALAENRQVPGGRLLARELERAVVVSDEELPANFARLGSMVRYRDLLSGRSRTLRIVAPQDADLQAERLSVISPIGAALIGLRPGDVFALTTEDGRPHVLQVLSVGAPSGVDPALAEEA
ncbi:MAG: GreA/GreB family elongation factor [Caulobacterales bacterium]